MIHAAPTFLAGTALIVWPAEQLVEDRAVGASLPGATVDSAGLASFSGLAVDTKYAAGATSSGPFIRFRTDPAPTPLESVESRVTDLETFEFFSNGADATLRDALAALTNADPFDFGVTGVTKTDDTSHNFDGGFFAVDVVTPSTTKAHCALQSVARVNTTGASGWGFNSLVVSDKDHTTGYGIWAGEFDVNYSGTDSLSVWDGAQNVKGVTSASGGDSRPFVAFGVEKGLGKAPWFYGLRFSHEDGESAVYDGGVSILDHAQTAAHVVLAAHHGIEEEPLFRFKADGYMEWGPGGSTPPDTALYREGAGALDTATSTLKAWHLYATNSLEVRGTGGAGYVHVTEQTVDPAAVADKARIFAKDNGSGKTQLCVRFGTGAVQILATEP